MCKKYNKAITIITLLLVLFISFYLYSQTQQDKDISEKISQHIKIIHLSNEISSYAKRAEGHLFLFLMLGKNSDREKFFIRTSVLNDYIQKIEPLLQDNVILSYSSKLQDYNNKLIISTQNVLSIYDQEKLSLKDFNIKENSVLIQEIHSLSSNIRKTGVELVDLSTSNLQNNKENINKKNKLKHLALGVFLIIILLFLIVIIYQSGKLSMSVKIKEMEKRTIFDATIRSTQHIVFNLLNQMQYFKLEADQSKTFDKEINALYEETMSEGKKLVDQLCSVDVLTAENINKSVYPE